MKKFGTKTPVPRAARDERGQRKSFRRDDEAAPRRAPPRPRDESAARGRSPGPVRFGAERPPRDSHADPYRPAQRPLRARGEGGQARGFTVTLDPDVARVFRGDASVNKALRLVIQLMEIAAPRPRMGGERGYAERPRRPGGYQGSAEARGFVRKPRFDESEE
jgi:hypothetical protein